MHQDIVEIKHFYNTVTGGLARRVIFDTIEELWPSCLMIFYVGLVL